MVLVVAPKRMKIGDQMVQIDRNSRILLVPDFSRLGEAEPILFESLHPVQQYHGRVYQRYGQGFEYVRGTFVESPNGGSSRDDFINVVSCLRENEYLVLRGLHSPRRWKNASPRNVRYVGDTHG